MTSFRLATSCCSPPAAQPRSRSAGLFTLRHNHDVPRPPDNFGLVNRATLDKDPHEVASMFDAVARRYDITNTVLSLGRDRFWRQATRKALNIGPGDRVLDLAAGTAVST